MPSNLNMSFPDIIKSFDLKDNNYFNDLNNSSFLNNLGLGLGGLTGSNVGFNLGGNIGGSNYSGLDVNQFFMKNQHLQNIISNSGNFN